MVIYNRLLPFKSFVAMALWPFIFVRKEIEGLVSQRLLNHEKIHLEQQKELGLIFFYIIYVGEWLYNLARYRKGSNYAYRMISFEIEAKANECDLEYLSYRRHYSQWRR